MDTRGDPFQEYESEFLVLVPIISRLIPSRISPYLRDIWSPDGDNSTLGTATAIPSFLRSLHEIIDC